VKDHGHNLGIVDAHLALNEADFALAGIRREEPWPHFVFDGFLEEAWYRRFAAEAHSDDVAFQIKRDDPFRVQFAPLDDLELAETFLSVEFAGLLRRMTGRWACVTERNAIQVRRSDASTPPLPVHHDSGGPPSAVAIYYVSTDWMQPKGGRLRLHPTEDAEAAAIIDPRPNRLVVFEARPDHWHSVEMTRSGARYSILSEWVFL
jgi:2OG-Fe(II) oxygenase superfamily